MAQFRISDRTSGDYGIYELDGLAAALTNVTSTPDEAAGYVALEAALKAQDWTALEGLSITLHMDVEWVA